MDGSVVCTKWRQCALPSQHRGATWRIRLTLCLFRPIGVPNPNGESIGSMFMHSSRQKVPILCNRCPFPSKLPLPMGDLDPRLMHGSLPTQVLNQTASRSVQPFCRCQWCERLTDRPTDHATRSATNGRIYVPVVLRCGLIIITSAVS